MKNTKKGFTLVELLVVIAILAILATVAIVGYTSFTKKAEKSADQQAVVQMNTALADLRATKDNISVDEVISTLIANKYNGDLTTYYSGYQLAWLASDEVIVLVENNAIVYPEAQAGKTGYELINPMVNDVAGLLGGLIDGKVVFVADDITAGEASDLHFNTAGDFGLNLNGNTIITNVPNTVKGYKDGLVVNEDANVVISNGTIEGGTEVSQVVAVYDNASLDIVDSIITGGSQIAVLAEEGGTITISDSKIFGIGTNPVQNYGGTLTLKNVTIAQSGESDGAYYYNSAIMIANLYATREDGSHYLIGEQSKTVIDGGNYSGKNTIFVVATGGDVTINAGTFTGTDYVINAGYTQGYESQDTENKYSSVITINGGTFNGKIKVTGASELVINGGTFVNTGLEKDAFLAYVADGATVVFEGETITK